MNPTPFEELPRLGELTRHYVLYDDGTLGLIESTSSEQPQLARPGVFLTEDDYLERHKDWEVAAAEAVDKLLQDDADRTLADHLALIAAGVPEDTARRLSGYAGPEPGSPGGGES